MLFNTDTDGNDNKRSVALVGFVTVGRFGLWSLLRLLQVDSICFVLNGYREADLRLPSMYLFVSKGFSLLRLLGL
jgi:hypothetical protein